MAFFSLPNEVIIEIVELLDKEQDINSLIRVSRRLYNLFDDYLYCYNIKFRRCSALFWAAKHGCGSTARKLLHLGADVNARVENAGSNGDGPKADSTPLHLAAWKGHLPMVKLLLEVGADPEARVREGMTPLFFALLARHEKVARTISRRISNLRSCLVDSTKRLTPLHVSCGLGLWSCATHFLNEGADVDATDASAMAPLHHALLIDVGGGMSHPDPDKVFETVKVLLEFRANQTLEKRPQFSGGMSMTARECGIHHPYERVRALFSDCAGDSLKNISKYKPHSLQIGRTWMLPSLSEMSATERDGPILKNLTDTERFLNSDHDLRTSNGDQGEPDNLDFSSFPFLHCANQPHISNLRMPASDGLWSSSNVDNLIAGFFVVNKPDTPSTVERNAKVNPFPQLNSHISENPLETEASKLWAGFGKPKSHSMAEQVSSSPSSEKSLLETKLTKVRGKNRWLPLQF